MFLSTNEAKNTVVQQFHNVLTVLLRTLHRNY